MNIKLNGFYYYKNDPEKDLVVIDKKGNRKPYKRNFFEKLGELLRYGETSSESFLFMAFRKSQNQYLVISSSYSSSLTQLNKYIQNLSYSSFDPLGEDFLEFTIDNQKHSLIIKENGEIIYVKFDDGDYVKFYFTQFT